MNWTRFLTCAALCAALILPGCGGGITSETITPAPPPGLKDVLKSISETGELGSAGSEVQAKIDELRKTDPAKADEMQKDFEALQKATSPDQVKTQATAMMNKL